MRVPYPRVATDADAHCYVCKGPLVKAGLSGYPAGNGGRVGFCEKCGHRTWYDLKTPIGVPIGKQDQA